MSVKNQNRMADSVDPDEMALYEPSHRDLYCLHMYLIWSAGLQALNELLQILLQKKGVYFCFYLYVF